MNLMITVMYCRTVSMISVVRQSCRCIYCEYEHIYYIEILVQVNKMNQELIKYKNKTKRRNINKIFLSIFVAIVRNYEV